MATASSEIIPRERLSAWQRWELAALTPTTVPDVDPGAVLAEADDTAPATAAALEEARATGYAEGRAQAAEEQALLRNLLERLAADVREIEQTRADQVLDLAVALARQIAGAALAVRREALLPIVQQALRELPGGSQRVEITLHPTDLAVVAGYLEAGDGGPKCQLVGDAAMVPGGCRVASEQCDVDATVPARWRRLVGALGRTDEWLAHD